MLLGSNLETDYGRGPLMMYNWPGNFFEVLGNGTFGLGTYTRRAARARTARSLPARAGVSLADAPRVHGDGD